MGFNTGNITIYQGGLGGSSGSGNTQVPGDTGVVDPTYDVYNKITGVVKFAETTIISTSFANIASPIPHLFRIEFGGNNYATYRLLINNVEKSVYYTGGYGGSLQGVWEFVNPGGGGKPIDPGASLKVVVEHCSDEGDGDFWARADFIEVF